MNDWVLQAPHPSVRLRGWRDRFRAWRSAGDVGVDWLLAFGVALVAALVRLRGLGAAPLWYDEIVTLNRATMPFAAMVTDALANMHLPTYFALVGLFAEPGTGAAGLRLPSAVLSSLAAGVVAVLGRRIGGTVWTGMAAGLLFALAPFQVLYGQEARAYALVVLAVAMSLAGLIRLVEAPDPAAERGAWALWAGGTLLAVYAMTLGALWLVVSTAVLLARMLTRPGAERPRLLARAGFASGAVLVLWLPWLPFLAKPVGKAAGSFWVPPASIEAVGQALSAVFLFRLVDPVGFEPIALGQPMLGVAVSAAALFGAWRLRRRRAVLLTLLATTLTLPLLLLAASWIRPVFIPRYLIWAALPFVVLAAAALGGLARPLQALAVALVAVFGLVNLEPYYKAELKPDWPGALRAAWAEAAPGDAIYLATGLEHFAAGVLEAADGRTNAAPQRLYTSKAVIAWLEAGGSVWVVEGFSALKGGTGGQGLAARLRRIYPVAAARPFGAKVALYRFDPLGPTGHDD